MKKILTVLLTLVMALCLINLNNSHTKAEDNPAEEISLYFKNGTNGLSLYTDSDATIEYEGKGTTWNVSSNNELELNNFNLETTALTALTIDVDATGIILKGKNKITMSRQTIAGSSDAIRGINIKRSNEAFSITGNGVLTVDTSAVGGTGNYINLFLIASTRPLYLNSNINLIDKPNIGSRTYSEFYFAAMATRGIYTQENLTIEDGVYNLDVNNTSMVTGIISMKRLFFNNGKIKQNIKTTNKTKSVGINGAIEIQINGGIIETNIDGDKNGLSTCLGSSDSTEMFQAEININKGTLILSTNQPKGELMISQKNSEFSAKINIEEPWYKSEDYKIVSIDDGSGFTSDYLRNSKGEHLSYIKLIIGNKPIPTPDPSPKDESCEKVIGPTWHWNNTKGVCEDYGVVGTYTR